MPELSRDMIGDGSEETPVVEKEAGFPTIKELTGNDRFQNMSAVRQAYTLGNYRTKLAKYLVDSGEVTNSGELNAAVDRISKTVDKYMPSGNSISAIMSSIVDRREILSEMAGLGATATKLGASAAIRNDLIRMQQAQGHTNDEKFFIPQQDEIEKYTEKFNNTYKEFESLRSDMEASLENDKDIEGRDMILGNGMSASTIALTGTRMIGDVVMASGAGMASGGGGAFAYYALTSAARSDRELRNSKPDMSANERFTRSNVTGVGVGAAEFVGFGYLTNGVRAMKLTKGMGHIFPESARRIAGASMAEASTEFAQTYIEHFGHNVEAFDDFVSIMQDEKVFNEALASAAIGGIMGGGIRGFMEVNIPNLEKVLQTDVYKIARTKLHEKVSKLDLSKRTREPISDLSDSIIKMQETTNKESKNLQNLEESREAGKTVGGLINEAATDRDIGTPQESGVDTFNGGRYEQSEILSASEAREQGEASSAQDSNLEGKDFIPQNNGQSLQEIIRESIINNGKIDVKNSSYFKDALQDSDSNPLFSPKFRAGKGDGLSLDRHIEILAEQGIVPRDVNPDVIIEALNTTKKNLQAMQNSQPTLEDLEIMAQENPNEDFENDINIELFDMQPSKKDEKSSKFPRSKARDEDGKLLKFFHGTTNKNNKLDINKSRDGRAWLGKGVYFTRDRNLAEYFATGEDIENGELPNPKAGVIEAELDLMFPFTSDSTPLTENESNVLSRFLDWDFEMENIKTRYDVIDAIIGSSGGIFADEYTGLQDVIRGLGYDSVVYGYDPDMKLGDQPSKNDVLINAREAVVFHNNQISQRSEDALFDMQPSKKSQKSANTTKNVPNQSLISEPSHTSLFEETPKEVKVDELPMSLSDLTKMSSQLIDNPTVIKKIVMRNPLVNGVYRQGDGIELKAGLAAGPEIKVYKKKVSREKVVEDVMKDEAIKENYPDLKEEDIILRDNGQGGVSVHKRDREYAAKTFAHEIGHLIDDIDAKQLEDDGPQGLSRRGNILGRLQGLKRSFQKEVLTNDGQIKDKIIRAELKNLTQYWKPFNVGNDQKYTRYRHSGPELYADAISVMFNKPGLLASMAPQFYKGFKTFLKNKPEVQDSYNVIQAARKNGDSAKNSLNDVIDMMQEAGALKELDAPKTLIQKLKGLFTFFRGEVLNTRASHISYKKNKGISDRVYQKFEDAHLDFLHSSGMASGYLAMQQNFLESMKESGISQTEFDAYMFLKLTANERADFFNPLGLRGDESVKALEALKEKMGDRFNKLPEMQKKFNNARQVAKNTIIKSGLFNEALTNKIIENDNYVTFDVVGDAITKNFSDHGSAKIMKVVGTLKDLKSSPLERTIHQDMALMHLAYLNTAKKTLVNDLVLPGDRVEATKNPNGDISKFHGKDKVAITYLEGGELKGFYIDKDLARLYDGSASLAGVVKVAAIVQAPVKELWVRYNPAFALRNTPRDATTAWKQLSDTFENVPFIIRPAVQAFMLAKSYAQVAPEVYKSVYLGKHSDYILKMEQAGEIHLADPAGVTTDMDSSTELERMMVGNLGKSAKDRNRWQRIMDAIPNGGKFTELLVRRAGKPLLENHSNLSPREITNLMREFGSPDFLDGGYSKPVMNSIFTFSNANLMGLRQNYKQARKAPADYIYKTFLANTITVSLAYMAMKGWLGDDAEEFYGKVDNLDLQHSNIIPLGINEKGEAKYIRIAQDHLGSMFSQMAWNALNGDLGGVVGSVLDQSPFSADNLNPALKLALETGQMISGISPTDRYNQQVVDRNLTGGLPLQIKDGSVNIPEGWKDFGRYQWNSVLGQQLKLDTRSDSGFSNIPFITSTSKVLYKETAKGEVQKEMGEYMDEAKERGGYIASYVSDLKNGLTEYQVKMEANKAFFKLKDKKEVVKSSFLRSFIMRYKRVKVLKKKVTKE